MEATEDLFKRAIAVGERVLGQEHPITQRQRSRYVRHLLDIGRAAEALPLAQAALATHEAVSGPDHPWTKCSARPARDFAHPSQVNFPHAVVEGRIP
jgi:hypothetical protein